MKRFLVSVMLMFSCWLASGQVYTGGKGDGAAISCVPPVVTTLSQTSFTCVSDTIVLAIHATGTNLKYRWQKQGANFFEDLLPQDRYLGLGTDTLRIVNPTSVADSGYYRCLVENSCDEDLSEVFYINLNRAPWVVNPMSLHDYADGVCVNTGSVDLIPTFGSERNDVRYAWKRIDTLSGVTTLLPDTLRDLKVSLAGPAENAEGLYVVTAYNECGMASDSVFLPVYNLPMVEWTNIIVDGVLSCCEFENLTLKAKISGGGSYFCYLQKIYRDFGETDWQIEYDYSLPAPSFPINMVSVAEGGFYRWAVYNECSDEPSYSDIIELKVEKKPSFVYPPAEVYLFPADTLVCEGGMVELMCKASGSGTKYYWTKDGVRIADSDTNRLIIRDIKEEDAGNYFCVAYNNCSERVTSRSIKVRVNLRPRFDRDPFMKRKACVGDSVTYFSVIPRGSDPGYDSLRWYLNRQPLYDNGHFEDCTSEDFKINYIGEKDLGLYQVEAYNQCGGTMSEVLNLMELAIPVSFKKGVGGYDALLCAGMEQKLSVSVTGSAPIHYKWVLNEHSYETDTNYVKVQGQDVVDLNKYTVFAYNVCGTAVDTGWVNVEVFEHYDFSGEGKYCAGHDPTGKLTLSGSSDTLIYNLYRDYGILVGSKQGTGGPLKFEDMEGGFYYIMAKNPKTECEQEMNGRPFVEEQDAPKKANFYASSYYCMGTTGAELVLTEWEKDVHYQLQRNQGSGFQDVPYSAFTGGVRIFAVPELNSPEDGQPRIYKDMDFGRYRVVATGVNGCTTDIVLEDSIYMLEAPSRHHLQALHGDTVNCRIVLSDGTVYMDSTQLEVDRFIEGATYTLYKNGVPDPDKQPDRTSPIGWAHINEGEYYVLVETREGCTGTTNKVRIYNVDAPKQQTLSASGSLCAELDTDVTTKTLTIDGTEAGIKYEVYRETPFKLWETFIGTGTSKDIYIPVQKATYYVTATDPTGKCKTTFKDNITVLASNFQVETNPADIYLDSKGLTAWLHVDITGSYVQPLNVVWEDESQLQQTGVITSPNTEYHKQYYWPFCPCAEKHDYWGSDWIHMYSHGPQCNATNCPYLYHAYKPAEHGCVYMGTEYNTWEWGGKRPWYDLYYCRDQIQDDQQEIFYENDESNPFRNRLTTPVNEDRTYKVTVTDGAGCVHEDQVTVRVLGGKLRAEIMKSEVHKHYEYPFCPCAAQHHGTHYCSKNCNDQNCIRLYHAHKHEGCTKRKTEYIEYRGSYRKYYDLYYCCTEERAADTIVYKNDELFFCSQAKGGDYTYDKTWSFYAPGYADATWGDFKGDTVIFQAKQSGWLYLRVTSMGQEVKDSIWIEVYRRPFTAYIQDEGGVNRIDSLYLCKGEETKLYAYTSGGDNPVTTVQWWGDDYEGPKAGWWMFTPEKSGWFYMTATNDDIIIKDSVYILLRERPAKPIVENPGVRCVASGNAEMIKVQRPTVTGVNYILEYSTDNGETFVEKDRYDNSRGGAISFKVDNPVRDAGVYRVKAESVAGDHHCPTYSDVIEFITPPSHDEITSLKYCEGEQLTIQLNSTSADMSYSILSNTNVLFETITAPVDYFTKPFGAGTYKIVYRHNGHYPFENGLTGSCADTVDIEIKKVEKPLQVDVVVNDGAGACEGLNAKIAIPLTERGVTYFLESPSGDRIDLFVGDGKALETTISGRSYGTYQVMGERDGCPTLVNWFTFNRNPKPVVQEDVYYCYPYGKLSAGEGVELKYDRLEADVTYTLEREGRVVAQIEGPGTKSFTNIVYGKYTVFARHNESNCFSSTTFTVTAEEAPKDFTLYAACEQERVIKLKGSQVGRKYELYRDTALIDSLQGTGDELSFGAHNETGIYTVLATDMRTGCTAWMNGQVQITELAVCDLIQERPTCSVTSLTDLIYPCSSPGWSYYLKDITTTDTLMSDIIAGNGADIRWSSVGPRMIKPYYERRVSKDSKYILYGRDVCGDVALDTIIVGVTPTASGKLSTENTANTTIESCENELENLYVSQTTAGADYVLIGLKDNGYRDSLTFYHADAASTDRIFLGSYKAYDEYRLVMDYKGCSNMQSISVKYKPMPHLTGLTGQSICNNEGELIVELINKVEDQNYYLYIDSKENPVDTITYLDAGIMTFKPQTENGRYWVIAENIERLGGGYARECRDTMQPTFAIGQAPQAYEITRYPEYDQGNIYLCKGDTGQIILGRTEKTVEYALWKDGVEYSDHRQFRKDGGMLSFPVAESGVYSVVGYLGTCRQEMLNTITVYVDTMPDLELYDTYYYCKGAETGAKIEVYGAPYLCTFELRDGGLGSPALEYDTVRFYHGDGISDTISFNHLCPAGEKYEYILTFQTRGGCRHHHKFDVVEAVPPTNFNVISTANAVCEGECTSFAVVGDQNNVEYSLMKVSGSGDYEYHDNYILGWGDRDTLWFPYPVCERGEYYITATYYSRPQCVTHLKVNGMDTVRLLDMDTIRECEFESYNVHYCADTKLGGTIKLLNAQQGVKYYLCREGMDPNHVGNMWQKTCTVEGETLEWENIPSTKVCDGGDFDVSTQYRVFARNTVSQCTKWMKGPIEVIADNSITISAVTYPYYEFCEGEGVLLKARAEGCGLSYEWYRVGTTSGAISVGRDADLKIGASGSYYCKVSNTCGTAETQPKITVNVKDSTSFDPMGIKYLCEGSTDMIHSEFFSVNDGDYIWYRAENPSQVLSTRPWLEFTNVTMADQGYYVCVGGSVRKGYCNVYADTVFVQIERHVDSAALVLKYDTICSGTTKAMSVNLTGYTVQWYFNGEEIPGETTNAYSKTFRTGDAGLYSIKISGMCGDRDLIPVYKIAVDTTIEYLGYLENKYLCSPSPLQLSVRTSPMTGVRYVWQELIAGQPAKTVGYKADTTVVVPEGVSHVTYRVYYYNTCNDFTTSAYKDMEVEVATNIKHTTPWPEEMTFCEGDPVSEDDRKLAVTLTGTMIYDYVWLFTPAGSTQIDTVARGELMDSYIVPNDHTKSGLYSCVVSTDCGRIKYKYSTWVRINTPATIITDLSATAGKMCEGAFYTPSITATGSDLQFRWVLYRQDGTVDTISRGIGYEWEDSNNLFLETEEKYAGDTLRCIVYNNCGRAVSTPVILEIEGKRTIDVKPETWVCYDSTATVYVSVLDSHGHPYMAGAWSYELYRDDYDPIARNVTAGFSKDTVTGLLPGDYVVKSFNDGVCNYAGKDMAIFKISERANSSATLTLPGGKRDTTLCSGAGLPLFATVQGGTGPFEVTIWHKTAAMTDWEIYNEWVNVNPFYVEAVDMNKGYEYTIPAFKAAQYKVTIKDLNNGVTMDDACPVFMMDSEILNVNIVEKSTVNWKVPIGDVNYGHCNLPINLVSVLGPTPSNGIFHITKQNPGAPASPTVQRNWTEPYILQSDGPGIYEVTYSTGGVCNDATLYPVIFTIDSAPSARMIPLDTIICTSNTPPHVYVEMHGAAPFKYLRVETSRLGRDGVVDPFATPGWEGGDPVGTVLNYPRQRIPFYISANDSVVQYVVRDLVDAYGCTMTGQQPGTAITISQLPQLKVEGSHPAYGNGYWSDVTSVYNLPEGDSVKFRVSLTYGKAPWKLKLFQGENLPIYGGPAEYIVHAKDTVIVVKKEGYYVFDCQDQVGCSMASSGTVTKRLVFAPSGFLKIEGLYLGGAMAGYINTNITSSQLAAGLMSSSLYAQGVLPDYGLAGIVATNPGIETKFIDWVFIEARKRKDDGTWIVAARDTCMLLNNGSVMARNGSRTIEMKGTGTYGDTYNIAIFHRNHLPVMTKALQLTAAGAAPVVVQFGIYSSNFWLESADSKLEEHVWDIATFNGYNKLWAMAPAYTNINKIAQLVSMSNPNAAFFKRTSSPSYSLYDVNFDGIVDFPAGYSPTIDQLDSYGSSEDAWLLYLNRDRFSEIDPIP